MNLNESEIKRLEAFIDAAESQIDSAKARLSFLKSIKSFIPSPEDVYYYLDDCLIPRANKGHECYQHYSSHNCYPTLEYALSVSKWIKVHRSLQELANSLNKESTIDWSDLTQAKYCLVYSPKYGIDIYKTYVSSFGCIYCLKEKEYLTQAKQLIEESDLILYLKGV